MRIVVMVIVGLIMVLLTLVGIYGATSTIFTEGGEEIEDEGSNIISCFGQATSDHEENECQIFGGSERDD